MTASHSSGFFRQESAYNLASFNVRGLTSATKRQQLCEDLLMYRVSVACLQETKCSAGLDDTTDKYRLVLIPADSRHYGQGFPIHTKLVNRIHTFWKVSDRVSACNSPYVQNLYPEFQLSTYMLQRPPEWQKARTRSTSSTQPCRPRIQITLRLR